MRRYSDIPLGAKDRAGQGHSALVLGVLPEFGHHRAKVKKIT
jgi:hypothetical protein